MKVGSVVQLKSGGPHMTVTDISTMQPDKLAIFTESTEFAGTVACRWFTTENDVRDGVFVVDTLEVIKEN